MALRFFSFLAVAVFLGFAGVAFAFAPANPNTNASARQTLDYVQALQAAGFIIAGQQVGYTPWIVTDLASKPAGESELARVRNLTGGKLPGLVALDWDGCATHADRRAAVIQLAKDQWAAGGLVSFSWHEANPRQLSPDASFGQPNSSWTQLTGAEWNDLLNVPGSVIHQNWLHHMDTLAGWLKQLRDAGVVVLWRPYHEVDGGWFWWNSNTMFADTLYRRLWAMQFDRLANFHGLDNLLWVYAPVRATGAFYPAGQVDIAGHDYYSADPQDGEYWARFLQIGSMVGGRPVALTEAGRLPSLTILTTQARYAWVTVWFGDYLDRNYYGNPGRADGNTAAEVQAFYAHPRVVDRANFRRALLAPTVAVPKRKARTPRAKFTLRGTVAGMNVTRVEVRVSGKRGVKPARGLEPWSAVVKLKRSRTKVTVQAIDALGRTSAPVRVTITRRGK